MTRVERQTLEPWSRQCQKYEKKNCIENLLISPFPNNAWKHNESVRTLIIHLNSKSLLKLVHVFDLYSNHYPRDFVSFFYRVVSSQSIMSRSRSTLGVPSLRLVSRTFSEGIGVTFPNNGRRIVTSYPSYFFWVRFVHAYQVTYL